MILFVGPVHGHEVEALTGLTNLISIMDTGYARQRRVLNRTQRCWVRERQQTELRKLGRPANGGFWNPALLGRLLIIPAGNPDGIARLEPRALQGMGLEDVRFWGQGTWSDDTFCGWPESKRRHPMPAPVLPAQKTRVQVAGENIGPPTAGFEQNPALLGTFECPHGLSSARACKVGFEEILDIQLALYEAMMRHELAKKAGQEKIL